MNTYKRSAAVLAATSLCMASGALAQTVDPAVMAVMESSFRTEGIANKDRIILDDIQALCSDRAFRDTPAGQKKAIELQSAALKAIKPPSDGKYLGDWKEGEKVAQSGRGATWSDSIKTVNGPRAVVARPGQTVSRRLTVVVVTTVIRLLRRKFPLARSVHHSLATASCVATVRK